MLKGQNCRLLQSTHCRLQPAPACLTLPSRDLPFNHLYEPPWQHAQFEARQFTSCKVCAGGLQDVTKQNLDTSPSVWPPTPLLSCMHHQHWDRSAGQDPMTNLMCLQDWKRAGERHHWQRNSIVIRNWQCVPAGSKHLRECESGRSLQCLPQERKS